MNNEEKRKVGRPKLADDNLKKQSIIQISISCIAIIVLTIFGLFSLFGINTKKLSGNIKLAKLSAKAYNSPNYIFDTRYDINSIQVKCWLVGGNYKTKCEFKPGLGSAVKHYRVWLYTNSEYKNEYYCGKESAGKSIDCDTKEASKAKESSYYNNNLTKENGKYVIYAFVGTYKKSIINTNSSNYGYGRFYKIKFSSTSKAKSDAVSSLVSRHYCKGCKAAKEIPEPTLKATTTKKTSATTTVPKNVKVGLKCTHGSNTVTSAGTLSVPYGDVIKCTTETNAVIKVRDDLPKTKINMTSGYARSKSNVKSMEFNFASVTNNNTTISAIAGNNRETVYVKLYDKTKESFENVWLSCTYNGKTVTTDHILKVPYGGKIQCKTRNKAIIYTAKRAKQASGYNRVSKNVTSKKFKFTKDTKSPINVAAKTVDGFNKETIKIELYDNSTTKANTTKQNTTKQNTTRQSTTNQNTTRQNTTRQNTTRQNTTRQNTTRQNTTKSNTTRQNTTRQQGAPGLTCTYGGKTISSGGKDTQTKSNTGSVLVGSAFKCKTKNKSTIVISTKCGKNYENNNKFTNVTGKNFRCDTAGRTVSVRAQNGSKVERVFLNIYDKNAKCEINTITPGKNSASFTVKCDTGASMKNLNIYKPSGAVISRTRLQSNKLTINKLSVGKYKAGIVYNVNGKENIIRKEFEITNGDTYNTGYLYNLTKDEMCTVEYNSIKYVGTKLKYNITCGSKATVLSSILYDETDNKLELMAVNSKKEQQYYNIINNNGHKYHIRISWKTSNNNAGTNVSKFVKSTSAFIPTELSK